MMAVVAAGIVATVGMTDVSMGMPVPAFMGVERVLLVCRVSPAETPALGCRDLLEQARRVLVDGLSAKGRGTLPVQPVEPGDEALADGGGLVVALHATVAGAPGDSSMVAIAVEIRRPGQVSDGIPFFLIPPSVVVGKSGDMPGKVRAALRTALGVGVVDPLVSVPGPR
ncbi:hypothetical protein [Azospirillum oleiclasticum]|nr:hypothetical protein [Azospirillum oleiclasticum]